MHNQQKRDNQYISSLADFIRREYGLAAVSVTPAKRGFYGETWRLDTSEHSYFLKLVYFAEHQNKYELSFTAVEHLCSHGINFISRIVKAMDNRLFTRFDGAVLGVFDWIDGENIETDETKIPEYQMLAKIYKIPAHSLQIPVEDFSGASGGEFFRQWEITDNMPIISLLEKKRAKLEYRAERLKYYSVMCKKDTTGFFITHGDAGGNFFAGSNQNYIVDWDEVMYAPPERDAWVMGFREWARRLFQKSLQENGIDYTLQSERLAYYCYYMFFYWLTWLVKCSQVDEIADFFNSYGGDRIEYADVISRR